MTKGPYLRLNWRGHRFDYRTVAALKETEHRLGKTLSIFQGSYSTSVGASAGTHDGGGAADVWCDGVDPDHVVRVMRNVGWAAWHRTPAQGPWQAHIHAILAEHETCSTLAAWQVGSYLGGGTGLSSGGPDPDPYRPDPPVVFHYWVWVKEQNLRSRLAQLGRSIKALRKRRKDARRQLKHLGE